VEVGHVAIARANLVGSSSALVPWARFLFSAVVGRGFRCLTPSALLPVARHFTAHVVEIRHRTTHVFPLLSLASRSGTFLLRGLLLHRCTLTSALRPANILALLFTTSCRHGLLLLVGTLGSRAALAALAGLDLIGVLFGDLLFKCLLSLFGLALS